MISKGLIIRPLQTILLIAALHDINLFALWIPSEENIVADAASRHDYEKLFNLSLQATRQPVNTSNLRRKLLLRNSFAPSTRQIYENLEAITPHFVKKKTESWLHPPFPCSVEPITAWFAYIMHAAKPATAKSYLNAIRFYHITNGFSTSVFNNSLIELVTKGGKRIYDEGIKRLRFPLTCIILTRILDFLNDHSNS